MQEYNAAFFGLFTNVFKNLKSHYGTDVALKHFAEIMREGLINAYGDDFEKGSFETFAALVGERDENVGLEVTFEKIDDNSFYYRFHTDPFPNLKGMVESHLLDKTYMQLKVDYLLGDGWSYKTTKHLWNGDDVTEHLISKVL